MMTQNADKKREQVQFLCMDDMVPQDHLLRIIDKAIDWNFIYDLVVEKYSRDNGRPSMDPVMLIKIPFIQYLYGIKSMRQTCKEIEVNVAYRWFLGLDMMDKVPHFSTFGKNYTRRFKDTDLFEQIFSHILMVFTYAFPYRDRQAAHADCHTRFILTDHITVCLLVYFLRRQINKATLTDSLKR